MSAPFIMRLPNEILLIIFEYVLDETLHPFGFGFEYDRQSYPRDSGVPEGYNPWLE